MEPKERPAGYMAGHTLQQPAVDMDCTEVVAAAVVGRQVEAHVVADVAGPATESLAGHHSRSWRRALSVRRLAGRA